MASSFQRAIPVVRARRAAARLGVAAFLLMGAACPVLGLVAPDPRPLDAVVRPSAWILDVPQTDPDSATRAGLALASFHARVGGTWFTPIDRRTGRALLFEGSGIPMYPGAGNDLKASDLASGILDGDGRPTLAGVERLARGFLAENADLFLPSKGELVLSQGRSGILDDGRVAFADFDWLVDGIPVHGAQVFVRLNNGNLIQAGTHLVGEMNTPTVPVLSAADARARALAHAGLDGTGEDIPSEGEVSGRARADFLDAGHLLLLPIADSARAYDGPTGGGLAYRLAWEVSFRQKNQDPTWTARVDAASGEVLEFYDANLYAAQVTGGVYPRTVSDPEMVWPFFFTTVTGGGILATNMGGQIPTGAPYDLASSLDGKWFNTNCTSCTNPVQPAVSKSGGTGLLRFGTGGVDATGNGFSSKADRNAFYHLNITRLVAKKWLANSYLESDYPANVNITSSCNAFWNGSSVNFYRSSATCNNTGEIADVMQHEWGHGLDYATAGGDGATSEATGDINGMHATHSALLGPYFNKNGNPVRNLDRFTSGLGTLTVSNISSKCGGGSGPLGFEVHCEGEIYGQTQWDLSTALVAKYGNATGWRESEHIFYTALPQSVIYLPNQSGSIYNAYLAVDDDDGNLSNGTPNGNEIYTAFNRHEIASGSSVTSTPHCARPGEPSVTATAGCASIGLSWNAVPGATSYRVQRHQNTVPAPYLNLATVTGTSYTDTEVTPGVTYHYVVQAVNATSCESTINTDTTPQIAARPRLDATSVTFNDFILGGNHSGSVDPGESVDVNVTLQNAASVYGVGIGSTLSSATPGVTVTNASASYTDLAPDASAQGSNPYRIAVAGSVSCGTPIDLTLGTTAFGVSCPLETNNIRIQTGTLTSTRVNETFETAAWAVDPANSTATAGGWVRGDPVGTNFQPNDDVDPTGVNCWYTGANPGGVDTTDDVDNGQTTLLSSVYNLTGMNTAWVVYWRWFGQRDLGDDPSGDYYILEVSNNGGTSWTTVESLGDNVSVPFWTKVQIRIDQLLPLTSNMRFRVRVSDGPSNDDIIEAAIDDFQVVEYTCDMSAPCLVGPTFAGISSAAPHPNACGESDLSWTAGTSNCANGTVSYNVYRSTTSGFTPSPSNRVATGVTGTTYRDTLLTAGVTYYYIVRALDSRSTEDSNTVQRSMVGQLGPDSAPPIFAGVQLAQGGAGCRETTLTWSPGSDCTPGLVYEIYRGQDFYFTPDPSFLVAETTGTSYVDVAPNTATSYTYIVRARDASGNEEANTVRSQASSTILPRTLYSEDFESGPHGWGLGDINTAVEGQWQLGDPVGTNAQPEDDTTPAPGVNCWVTGLAGGGPGANDVDDGATSLVSPSFNLVGIANPVVKYNRWWSDDLGTNPDQDSFLIQVSNDGGGSWSEFDSTSFSSDSWEPRSVPLAQFLPPTANVRFQFIAQDQPGSPSTTEAAIDDFQIIDPTGGCSVCGPQAPVGKILVTKSGVDTTINWTADPVSAARYEVYRVSGPGFATGIRIGSTTTKSFVHQNAQQLPGSIFYLVSAVNACGQESAYHTP